MSLFTKHINNWDDWCESRTVEAFSLLVERIFQNENLPFTALESVNPGTNAVFKVGGYAIKIFVPMDFGNDKLWSYGTDVNVELFGMKWAEMQNVPAPRLIAEGMIEDKYHFRYMIMDFMPGKLLSEIEDDLSYDDKLTIGRKLRVITDRLNRPCENFTPIDVMGYATEHNEWRDEGFPESFVADVQKYLANFQISEKVYCHGDMHCDNVIIDENLDICIIDFADAMYAPVEYEHVYVASCFCEFSRPYLEGYFGDNYTVKHILDLCMTWLPIHAWGHSTLPANIGPAKDITSFDVMQEKLRGLIEKEKQKPHSD